MAHADNPAWVFETYLVPAVFAPWARVVVDLARPEPGERVLDAACGTGVVARLVAPIVGRSGRTVGLDFDPLMIRTARELDAEVEWLEGDLQNLTFTDALFDLVICQQGLQFLPDPGAGLHQIYRVLRPGGRMVLAVWTELAKSPGHAILFDRLGALLGIDMSGAPAWALADGNELLKLVSAAGFVEVETTVRSLQASFPSARRFVEILLEGSSKLTRQMLAQLPADRKTAFIGDVAAHLQSYETSSGLQVPMESRLLVGRKH